MLDPRRELLGCCKEDVPCNRRGEERNKGRGSDEFVSVCVVEIDQVDMAVKVKVYANMWGTRGIEFDGWQQDVSFWKRYKTIKLSHGRPKPRVGEFSEPVNVRIYKSMNIEGQQSSEIAHERAEEIASSDLLPAPPTFCGWMAIH